MRRDEKEIRNYIKSIKELKISEEKEKRRFRQQRRRFMKENRSGVCHLLNFFMSKADIFKKDGGFYRRRFLWGFGGSLYIQRAENM